MAVESFRKVLLTLSVYTGMLMVFGCAGTMSLEEAKKVSMEMSGTSFTPPPRRINDILSVLQTKGQFDKRIADRFQKELKKQPPKTDDAILAIFYYERGKAVTELGLRCEALSDLRKAVSHAEKTGSVSNMLLFRLGKAEKDCGSIKRSIELLELTAKSGHLSSADVLTFAYLAVGDITSANRAKDRAVEISQARLQQRSGASRQQTTWLRHNPAEAM